MSFSADLEKFAKKADVNMDTVLRKIMLDEEDRKKYQKMIKSEA